MVDETGDELLPPLIFPVLVLFVYSVVCPEWKLDIVAEFTAIESIIQLPGDFVVSEIDADVLLFPVAVLLAPKGFV
jgi:hypothetical protein